MEAGLLSFYLKKSSIFLALFMAEPENQGSHILWLQRRQQIWTQHGENKTARYFYPRLIIYLELMLTFGRLLSRNFTLTIILKKLQNISNSVEFVCRFRE